MVEFGLLEHPPQALPVGHQTLNTDLLHRGAAAFLHGEFDHRGLFDGRETLGHLGSARQILIVAIPNCEPRDGELVELVGQGCLPLGEEGLAFESGPPVGGGPDLVFQFEYQRLRVSIFEDRLRVVDGSGDLEQFVQVGGEGRFGGLTSQPPGQCPADLLEGSLF